MWNLLTDFSIIALGAVVGLIVGLTSVGAGALMTPILYLDFGSYLAKTFVVGTATTQGTITKFVASARNYVKNVLKTDYVLMIAITGVPLASIGAFYSTAFISWQFFQPALSFILIIVALFIILQLKLKKDGNLEDPRMNRSLRIKGLLVGVVVGIVAGLTGVSTGSIMVSALILLLKFPTRTAVSVALFEGGLILFAATVMQLYLGHVNLPFTGLLLIGGIPGILVGSHVKDKINQRLLGYGVAGVIIFESARTLANFFFGKSFFFF